MWRLQWTRQRVIRLSNMRLEGTLTRGGSAPHSLVVRRQNLGSINMINMNDPNSVIASATVVSALSTALIAYLTYSTRRLYLLEVSRRNAHIKQSLGEIYYLCHYLGVTRGLVEAAYDDTQKDQARKVLFSEDILIQRVMTAEQRLDRLLQESYFLSRDCVAHLYAASMQMSFAVHACRRVKITEQLTPHILEYHERLRITEGGLRNAIKTYSEKSRNEEFIALIGKATNALPNGAEPIGRPTNWPKSWGDLTAETNRESAEPPPGPYGSPAAGSPSGQA
jgi:hypothetical protein